MEAIEERTAEKNALGSMTRDALMKKNAALMAKVTGGTAPIAAPGMETYSNPLPHVLILTAIVVGVATTALGLALVVRIRNAFGSIEDEEIDELENQT